MRKMTQDEGWEKAALLREGQDALDCLNEPDLNTIPRILSDAECGPIAHNTIVDATNALIKQGNSDRKGTRFLVRCRIAEMTTARKASDTTHDGILEIPLPTGKTYRIPTVFALWSVIIYLLITTSLKVSPFDPLKHWLVGEENRVVKAMQSTEE